MANQEVGIKRERNEVSADPSAPQAKRQLKDPSLGFTKAVIICKSSELSRSEEKTYRPNNIVVELLKKNPMRYGKVVFARLATEEEIREELCLRFTILRNKKVSFASADQYGRLNFHKFEKWSGKNVRRWLPGSSAMYLILEGGDEDDEPANQPTYLTTSSNPSSGLSFTTMRTNPTNDAIMAWQNNRSQRALLDFLSSPERGTIDQSTRRKMFALTSSRAKTCGLPRSHSYPILTNANSKTTNRIHTVSSEVELHKNHKTFHTLKTRQNPTHDSDSNLSHHRGEVDNRGSKSPSELYIDRFKKSTDSTRNRTAPLDNSQLNDDSTNTQRVQYKTSTIDQVAVRNSTINDTRVTENGEDVELTDVKKLQSNRANMNGRLDFHSFCEQRIASSSLNERKSLTRSELIRDTIQSFVEATKNYSGNSDNSRLTTQPKLPKQNDPDDKTERHHGCASLRIDEQNGGRCPSREPGNHRARDLKSFTSELKNKNENRIDGNLPYEHWERIKKAYDDEKRAFGENNKKADTTNEKKEITNGENGGLGTSGEDTQRLADHDGPSCFVPCYMVPSPFYHSHLYRPMTSFTPALCFPRNGGVAWKELHDSLRSNHVMYEGNMVVPATRVLPSKEVFSDAEVDDSRMEIDEDTADQSSEERTDFYGHYEIIPNKGTCKGGDTFVILFKDPLQEQLSVTFHDKSAVDLIMDNPYVLKGKTPESKPGRVTVTIATKASKVIGQIPFTYLDDVTECLSRGTGSPAMTSSSEEDKDKTDDVITVVKCESPAERNIATDNSSQVLVNDTSHSGQRSTAVDECVAVTAATNKNDLKEADNLLLLSSIASKIENHTTPTNTKSNNSKHHTTPTNTKSNNSKHHTSPTNTKPNNSKHHTTPTNTKSNNSKHHTSPTHSKSNNSKHHTLNNTTSNNSKHPRTKDKDNKKDQHNTGFHKKVFVLPANSLYLPSQSDLCKLRMTGNCYSKILFHASMSEDDVIAQIRTTFPDLRDSRLRLAIVDQTGRLVFHDDVWTGRTIRKKLRGNSVLYVAPFIDHCDVMKQ